MKYVILDKDYFKVKAFELRKMQKEILCELYVTEKSRASKKQSCIKPHSGESSVTQKA